MSVPEFPPSSPDLTDLPATQVAACLSNPETAEFIKSANEKYYYWTEFRRRPIPRATDVRLLWLVTKALRKQSAWVFNLLSAGEKWKFSYNLPKPLHQIIYDLDQKLGGERSVYQALLSGQERNHLRVNSRMEEAIASSQMEGASTTREVAKQLLRTRRKPLNRSERMIVNNYQTIRYLQDVIHRQLTVEDLLEIQALAQHEAHWTSLIKRVVCALSTPFW